MSISRWMDQKAVVHIHNGVLHICLVLLEFGDNNLGAAGVTVTDKKMSWIWLVFGLLHVYYSIINARAVKALNLLGIA